MVRIYEEFYKNIEKILELERESLALNYELLTDLMDRGVKESGVKRIRIHDLRHSHVALLIELGFSPVAIAERMGHESITITLGYAHLYPSKQSQLADKLDELKHDENG